MFVMFDISCKKLDHKDELATGACLSNTYQLCIQRQSINQSIISQWGLAWRKGDKIMDFAIDLYTIDLATQQLVVTYKP